MTPKFIMTQEWLKKRASELGGGALLFVEGYEWTGLAIWRNGEFDFPVDFAWRLSELEEIRLFSDAGEWHCWRTGAYWDVRWAQASKWIDRIERRHVLWGRDCVADGDWWRLQEANGTSLAIPFQPKPGLAEDPVQLVVWHLLEPDPDTGQHFVADAMFRQLVQ